MNSKYQSTPGGRGWFVIADAASSSGVDGATGDPSIFVSDVFLVH